MSATTNFQNFVFSSKVLEIFKILSQHIIKFQILP